MANLRATPAFGEGDDIGHLPQPIAALLQGILSGFVPKQGRRALPLLRLPGGGRRSSPIAVARPGTPRAGAGVDKKIVVVAAEAAAVRTIFARYLELGSVRLLAEDLDRRGIRSKPRRLSTGRTIGGGRFGVGALAHLLKNRFYIGEVAARDQPPAFVRLTLMLQNSQIFQSLREIGCKQLKIMNP
jgi:hypothetical protein